MKSAEAETQTRKGGSKPLVSMTATWRELNAKTLDGISSVRRMNELEADVCGAGQGSPQATQI